MQHWTEPMCFLSIKACKPILVVTQKKIMNLQTWYASFKPKHDLSLTLTKCFFVPEPRQVTDTTLFQHDIENLNLKNWKVATSCNKVALWFAETYIANIYADDWVGHRLRSENETWWLMGQMNVVFEANPQILPSPNPRSQEFKKQRRHWECRWSCLRSKRWYWWWWCQQLWGGGGWMPLPQ